MLAHQMLIYTNIPTHHHNSSGQPAIKMFVIAMQPSSTVLWLCLCQWLPLPSPHWIYQFDGKNKNNILQNLKMKKCAHKKTEHKQQWPPCPLGESTLSVSASKGNHCQVWTSATTQATTAPSSLPQQQLPHCICRRPAPATGTASFNCGR